MRHDYDLPRAWAAMTDGQKDRWFKGERARRQALQQDTPLARHAHRVRERLERKAAARSGTIDVEANR